MLLKYVFILYKWQFYYTEIKIIKFQETVFKTEEKNKFRVYLVPY